MKPIYTVLASLFLFALVSCQKETSEDLPPNVTHPDKIKTYTEEVTTGGDHQTEVFDVLYDNQDRITSLVSTTNAGNKFEFDYVSASLFTIEIFNSNHVVIHEDLHIGANNLADSGLQYNDEGDTTVERYYYNPSKLLTRIEQYDKIGGELELWDITAYTYDSNGNVATESDSYSTTTYTYDEVVPNTVALAPIFMFSPKQLPTKEEFSDGTNTYTLTHTYTFDDKKRITQDKAVGSNSDVVTKSYTYY